MEKAGIEYDDGRNREYLVEGENVNTVIERPPVPKLNASKDNLVFMQLDLDY